MVDLKDLKPGTKVWHYTYVWFPLKLDLREVEYLAKIYDPAKGNTQAVLAGYNELAYQSDMFLTKAEAIESMKLNLKYSVQALEKLQSGISQAEALIAEHESSLALVAAA